MENLVDAARQFGVSDTPKHIATINDAMDAIRWLEAELKAERECNKELQQKIIRQKVRVYNGNA